MTAQLKSGIHSFAAAKCEQFSSLNLPSPLYRSLSSVLMVTSGGGSFLSSLTGNFHIFSLACVVVVVIGDTLTGGRGDCADLCLIPAELKDYGNFFCCGFQVQFELNVIK